MLAPKVTMYTKDYCPYCVSAKRLLNARGIPFEEINIENWEREKVLELHQRSGMRTVPQIFFGDELIGGYTELAARDAQDQLAFMKQG